MIVKNNQSVNPEIRELRHTDEAHECAQFMANSEPWITLRRTYDDSMEILSDPSKEVYIAVVRNEIVGFVILQMCGAFNGYIQSVGVIPQWRNRGIGSSLIKFAEDRIFGETPNVFICVSSFNKKALKLYERLGYEIIGELKNYIVPNYSEILLRKTIASLTEYKVKS